MKGLNKLILIIVAGFVLVLGLFVGLIHPKLNQIQQLKVLAEQKQTDLQTLAAQILAYKNSQADLNAVQDKNKVLARILPRQNLQTAIAEVEQAALAAGLTQALTIDEQLDEQGQPLPAIPILTGEVLSTEIPYTMSITGPFLSLLKFLQDLEHLPHFTEISKITLSAITSDTNKEGLASHTGNITGSISGVFLVKKSSQ